MALNFQQVMAKIQQIVLGAPGRREAAGRLRRQALDLHARWAGRTGELAEKVERVRQADASLRCAIPTTQALDTALPAPTATPGVTLLAADGSQITPDRHGSVLFSLVNVGTIVMRPGSAQAPEIETDSILLHGDELLTPGGLLSADSIAQRRDLAERRKLLEVARGMQGACIALTDGPVELWGTRDGPGADDFRRAVEEHKSILSQLQERGVITAGYVDKPGADLVVRLLEIAALSLDEFKKTKDHHPLRGVSDRWLFSQFLHPGQRSAVFAIQSPSRAYYTGGLALHFFYLNVGQERHPWIVRVEMPGWVAADEHALDTLHACLLEQCRIMGARPYPYILHRAHEIAVVGLDEKRQVEQMLEVELRRAGEEVGEPSAKQSAKDLPGRSSR